MANRRSKIVTDHYVSQSVFRQIGCKIGSQAHNYNPVARLRDAEVLGSDHEISGCWLKISEAELSSTAGVQRHESVPLSPTLFTAKVLQYLIKY